MPKTLDAEALRQRSLAIIEGANGPISAGDVQIELFGDTKDPDEHRRRQQRLRHSLLNLIDGKHIVKVSRGYYQINNGRPVPQVHDLPSVRRKAGRPIGSRNTHANGHKNGAANGDLRAYLIRDIRGKLTELEALLA
jgi:hypothetical protein